MKNDKTYKKLEENWKKMEEGIMPPTIAVDAGSKLANANAGVDIKDNLHKVCNRCKNGTYEETSLHDDIQGKLHCTNCNHEVFRYPKKGVV